MNYVAYRLTMKRQGSRWLVNKMATINFLHSTPQIQPQRHEVNGRRAWRENEFRWHGLAWSFLSSLTLAEASADFPS